MAGKMSEMKTDLFVTKCLEETESPEFIVTEVSIKQEPELIIEDELETEKICKYLQKNNLTQEDRLNLIWHSCVVCEERFLNTDDLTLHSQNHDNSDFRGMDQKTIEVTDFQCTICNKIFATKRNLNNHLRLHTGERPFKCDTCGRSFAQNGNLRIHIKTHTGERPFQCQECGRSFLINQHLREHMRTHTGEKPFKCDNCNKSFSQRSSLAAHMKIHTGEKPFKCENCEFSFAQKSSLRNHMRIHTGLKPFKCDHCVRSFTRRTHLRVHMKKHTS